MLVRRHTVLCVGGAKWRDLFAGRPTLSLVDIVGPRARSSTTYQTTSPTDSKPNAIHFTSPCFGKIIHSTVFLVVSESMSLSHDP